MTVSTSAESASLEFNWIRRLPIIRQAEAAECGLACLAMIARYRGVDTDLITLRRNHRGSGRGHTLKDLIDIATQINLSARPVRVPLEAIPQLQCPCILHWDMNHFVVLKSVGRRHAVIHNPARGVEKLDAAEFSKHFTGVALELLPTGTLKKQARAQRLRLADLWSSIVGLKRSLAHILFLSLLLQLFAVAAPFYMQTIVDDVALRGDPGLLAILAMGFALLLTIEAGTGALRSALLLQLSTRLHLQLAANLCRHLLHLPIMWFQRRHLGDILSRFSSIDAVREILSSGLISAVVDGLMAVIMLGIMTLYNVKLTLLVVAVLLVYIALRLMLFNPLRRLSEESIAKHALCDTNLLESARSMQTIKLFQRESEREGLWQNRLADAINADIRVAQMGIGFDAANTLLFGIENILVIYFAALAVMDNDMTIGMLFAFISYKQRFSSSVSGLVDQVIELMMLGLHLERLGDIALTEPEPQQRTSQVPDKSRRRTSLQTHALGFRYGDSEPWIFEDISIEIPAGSCVAITGPSGVGKSTLLGCLMGLTQPTTGEILVNGRPLQHCYEYRKNIAAVTQSDQLLSGSILENIACFDQRLHFEKAMYCAKKACIHDDIMEMPMQYNTLVGDMGSTLSGGQAQRIMLARALYRVPSVLFLDEATSHLDVDTERRINGHIAVMKMTRVIVAHRPETIALANRVIELSG